MAAASGRSIRVSGEWPGSGWSSFSRRRRPGRSPTAASTDAGPARAQRRGEALGLLRLLGGDLELVDEARAADRAPQQPAAAAQETREAPAFDIGRRSLIAGAAEVVDAELDLAAADVDLPELGYAGEGVERRQAVAVLALRAVADHLDHQVGSALELDEAPLLAARRRHLAHRARLERLPEHRQDVGLDRQASGDRHHPRAIH